MAWDEEHERPVILVRDTDAVAGERGRVRRVLTEAKKLAIAPDIDSATPTQFDREIPSVTDLLSLVNASLLASLGVASRMGLPLFSDDRVIRNLAREIGIPSFGTVGLLAALEQRSFIGTSVNHEAVQALVDAGAIELWHASSASER